MKKLYSVLLLSLTFFFIFSSSGKANGGGNFGGGVCIDPATSTDNVTDFISKGKGLVPCGSSTETDYTCTVYDSDNKSIDIFTVMAIDDKDAQQRCVDEGHANNPTRADAYRVEPTENKTLLCPCEFEHIFIMILKVYNFIVWNVSLPTAGLMILLGGGLMLLAGFNPAWFATGKAILWGTAIGLVLIFGSWLIIDVVLKTIGYGFTWNVF